MEYKIGLLTAFLNKTKSEDIQFEEENVKKRKKTKKKRHTDETNQHKRILETESEDFIPLELPPGFREKYIVKDESEHIAQEKIAYNKKSNEKQKKDQNSKIEIFNVNNELIEDGNKTHLKSKKQKKQSVHFQEGEENSSNMPKQKDKNRRKKYQKTSEDYDKDKRTVFVGNLPVTFNKEEIKNIFKSFGVVESIRIRSAAPIKPTLPKKVAVIKNLYHPDITSYNAYIVFKTEHMAMDSLKLNGTKIQDNHIRVDRVNNNQQHDYRKTIFVGNLPYNITDEELWKFFETCGEIINVRVIRDKSTRIGKGFGYVLFKSRDSSNRAIKMDGNELKGRPLRISRASKNENKKFQRNKTFVQKSERNWKFQGMAALEKQKMKKKKKMIKLRLQQKQKKQIAQKLQSRTKMF
ncbi:RNA-binding protein 34-like isoform X1 [Centruroides sculpturatus]|uniref:RNA-binding protein 34-like isoform X1 n=1 Tax=Centruroides sculpturatus TaxID=218467 RepID=UPI000C6E281D|nr:RNA-binding protein 34-like isoform X1 [Centruroides sculpturatus]XP_023227275.1 RNA-binding protein 34-like isoform X1 [Centruroides sculpturatus]XP_023227276.1 RNA-binding protein 34-like isoform X1 [Centruroides sculpturatus]